MSTLASKPVADAVDVKCTDDELIVTLVDGRRVSAPLAWFPRLLRATPKQRANWRLIGRGVGIHWDDVDEDISVVAPCLVNTRYELIIYWSKDDESFVVEVPELPGCMADGQTYAEAVANAEVVIDEWIETARKLGRLIPEPRGKLAYA
jgi:predicted RNase H-like HicB family nuclease